MNETTKESPMSITVTFDIQELIDDCRVRYDSDGDEISKPTLGELVIAKLARDLRRELDADTLKKALKKQVDDLATETVRAELQQLVPDVISASIQPTNRYGEPVSEPTTLREIIIAEAKEQLTKKTGDSYNRSSQKTAIAKIIETEVGNAFQHELKKEVDAAKTAAKAVVKERAAEVIQDTIDRMARA